MYCSKCVPAVNRENLLAQAKLGRIATHSAIAEARRAATHARHVEALRKWNASDLPGWLDEETYKREILPRLTKLTVKAIRLRLDVSHPYATLIKRGLKIPHPRHWMPLTELAGITRPGSRTDRQAKLAFELSYGFRLQRVCSTCERCLYRGYQMVSHLGLLDVCERSHFYTSFRELFFCVHRNKDKFCFGT